MQLISVRIKFLALTFVAIASLGGVMTACSNTSQNDSSASRNQSQAQNSPVAATHGKHGTTMNHGSGKNHTMAMDLGPADANYDLRFVDAMIPHHQGAVTMAQDALTKSQRSEIKKLAQGIITDQKREIKQLQQWRTQWYPKASSTPMAYDSSKNQMVPMSQEQMQSMMMEGDLGAADAKFDLRFIDAMIPHHESAISMAQGAIAKSKRPEIKQLAQEIVKAQEAEIKQMKQWRQAWYKQ